MKNILLLIFVISITSSCQRKKPYDLKSPCVSSENGPCVRTPVNTWMTDDMKQKHFL